MKKIFLIMLIAAGNTVLAQDVFQEKFYTPELVLKYREEAGLSDDQVEKIKAIYNNDLPVYNNKKWDLDAEMAKLENLVSEKNVDEKAAAAQLAKTLTLEAEIKKMKLIMLIKVKNTLTPEQQTTLDIHKGQRTGLNNENVRLVLRGNKGLLAYGKALFHIIDGSEEKIVTEFPKDIAPENIESVQVLSGAAAKEKYGARGENGVVVLTLKKK